MTFALLYGFKKWENFENGNHTIFVCLYIALWSSDNMNSHLLDGSKRLEIVFCWNNCSGYSEEKCFKCNLIFPKLSRMKKGQQVKGF